MFRKAFYTYEFTRISSCWEEEALKTCNELHIHISTPREKPLSHGDCRACEETNNLLQSKCICEITFTYTKVLLKH